VQRYIANVLICIVGLEDFISGIANWVVAAFDLSCSDLRWLMLILAPWVVTSL